MKRVSLNRVCVFLGLVSLCCATSCSAAKAVQYQASSPNGTYAVSFTETIESKQGLMFDNRVVEFSLVKDGAAVLSNEVFSREKADAPSFRQKYLKQDWKAENVLRLGKESLPELDSDEITVSNLASKKIDYLHVITFQPERFLIFDLQPQSIVRLHAYSERDPAISSATFIVSGKFSDAQRIDPIEVTFQLQRNLPSPARYCVFVTDEKVFMSSSSYDGAIYDSTNTVEALRRADPGSFSPKDIPKPEKVIIPRGNCKME